MCRGFFKKLVVGFDLVMKIMWVDLNSLFKILDKVGWVCIVNLMFCKMNYWNYVSIGIDGIVWGFWGKVYKKKIVRMENYKWKFVYILYGKDWYKFVFILMVLFIVIVFEVLWMRLVVWRLRICIFKIFLVLGL